MIAERAPVTTGDLPLPYPERMGRMLGDLHRAFIPTSRMAASLLSTGLAGLISNPFTGYLMVLRTRGRRSGRTRSVPLGYVIVDGRLYCCAGFGVATGWYRNVLAEPQVEVVLAGRTLGGVAEAVIDPVEWRRSYRALMASLGLVSRAVVGDLREVGDEELWQRHRSIPMVRITPTAFVAGAGDPGGRGWLAVLLGSLLAVACLVRRRR